jgi:O-antigen/teichoic acid export membrane protein
MHFRQLRSRSAKTASLVIVDQALFSTAGFISTVLLARLLPPDQFGIFSAIQSLAILTIVIHASLLIEPMSVLGITVFGESKLQYYRLQVVGHFLLSLALALLLVPILLVVLGSVRNYLPTIVTAVVLMHPLYLAPYLGRRYYYNTRQFSGAVGISLTYFLILPAAVFGLYVAHCLTSVSAWVAVGLASGLASSAAFCHLWLESNQQITKINVRHVIGQHFDFGGWVLVGAIFGLASQQLPIYAATRWLGPEAAAEFRALTLPMLPPALVMTALASAALASVVAAQASGDQRRVNSIALKMTVLFVVGSIAYSLLITIFARPILAILYGTKYSALTGLMEVASLGNIALGASAVWGLVMRAARWLRLLFMINVVSLLVAVVATATLVRSMGVKGAVYANLGVTITSAILQMVSCYSMRSKAR